MKHAYIIIVFISISIFIGCTSSKIDKSDSANIDLPRAEREFRGAWVATVANINWPSKRDLSTEEQKLEAINILDKLQSNNFNAVIFQARPQCDALYKSDLEPWSYYLTGKQGEAPKPFYDPLEFWITEAHKRGLELHVWLNPYRAHHTTGGDVSEYSIVKKHPDWVVKLKSGYWWLDPSKKEVQDHSLNVVLDITSRYDIDGIHFDDYFYPYPSYNDNEDFPDDVSWKEYQNNGGALTRADWRRNSINLFIERVYKGIKNIKPNVKFGLSPFGIWRPHNPISIEGFDQYEKLYADAKYWLNKGWIDYWSPQLYWKISSVQQSYPVLLGWWQKENIHRKHFWPGISIDRENNDINNIEVVNQIMTTRGMLPESPGNICWSVGPILKFKELSDAILDGPYKRKALIPETSWFNDSQIESPKISVTKHEDKIQIEWKNNNVKNVFSWIIYFKSGERWDYKILTAEQHGCELPLTVEYKSFSADGQEVVRKEKITEVAVSAVNRISHESRPVFYKIN